MKKSKEDNNCKPSDLFDFESELLDIARSVSQDEGSFPSSVPTLMKDRMFDEEFDGIETPATLSYSFNAESIPKADHSEDSARETMNLVEKLRMQYAFKTGPSSAAEKGGSDSILEPSSSSTQAEQTSVSQLQKPLEEIRAGSGSSMVGDIHGSADDAEKSSMSPSKGYILYISFSY